MHFIKQASQKGVWPSNSFGWFDKISRLRKKAFLKKLA
jgi:hypothetical protein